MRRWVVDCTMPGPSLSRETTHFEKEETRCCSVPSSANHEDAWDASSSSYFSVESVKENEEVGGAGTEKKGKTGVLCICVFCGSYLLADAMGVLTFLISEKD